MEYRELKREELTLLREIERSEVVKEVYYCKNNRLSLVDEFYDIQGWDLDELNSFISRLYDIYDRNGTVLGAFDNDKIVGLVALDSKAIGKNNDQLKLDMLYVSSTYRNKGIGKCLMNKISRKAKDLGAKSLYISATPFRNTVDFYSRVGAKLTDEIIKELYDLEPEDIHMVLDLN
ncbi:GNAT family N-acetyltransferase [Clostridium sp. D2Q-11]|uniref:GNAT family N-acetyltransferase n=1 Tax=Anaeromonas frigoriresistens TaxID=2683708 RepID=A0A942Z8F8_9FIRM|nr:GNAT family N-acetyltransferase [Anaeromonas frigoriresistens]MBS4538238.1 GNAT family N-acetyltransferase [Anaeromonas frigoriresistens]